MIPDTSCANTAPPAVAFNVGDTLAAMGRDIRRQRRRMALTLDDLAALAGASKPYLSLIENAKVPRPPSTAKLAGIESALKLPAGSLVNRADLLRAPDYVRRMLETAAAGNGGAQ